MSVLAFVGDSTTMSVPPEEAVVFPSTSFFLTVFLAAGDEDSFTALVDFFLTVSSLLFVAIFPLRQYLQTLANPLWNASDSPIHQVLEKIRFPDRKSSTQAEDNILRIINSSGSLLHQVQWTIKSTSGLFIKKYE